MIYRCVHVGLKELVHPKLLELLHPDCLWRMIGSQRARALDLIREDYEAELVRRGLLDTPQDACIYINGIRNFVNSGVRLLKCKTGAKDSRHKHAEAWDLKCLHPGILYDLCVKNAGKYRITRIEDPGHTPGWVHLEIDGQIAKAYVFKP